MTDIFADRMENVRNALAENKIDTLMVLVEENRRYLTGYTGHDGQFDETAGVLFISGEKQVLATDSRFDVQAASETTGWDIVRYQKGMAEALPAIVQDLGTQRLGFEAVRLSYAQYRKIVEALEKAGVTVEMVAVEEIVEQGRLIKSETEIDATRNALAIAEKAFEAIQESLVPGMTEKQTAWRLEKAMRDLGADELSFPVICAAGTNAALPHAIPGDRVFQQGDVVLFDWGARLNGYCSDISRTISVGPPDDTFKSVYRTVREAQKRAIDAIADGASSKAVDAVARDFIEKAGFKGKFGHGLGHGTGLAVHEGPRLSPLKDAALRSGMIVTVEPGIYLPRWGGVRLENQVVVRDGGAEVLNRMGFLDI